MKEQGPKYVERDDLHGPIAEDIVESLPDGLPKELRKAAVEVLIITAGMLEAMGAPESEVAKEIAQHIHEDMTKDLSGQ